MWNTKLQKEVHDDKIKLQKKQKRQKKQTFSSSDCHYGLKIEQKEESRHILQYTRNKNGNIQ